MQAKTIGSFISALRRASGMTQREFAERLNVSDKSVSRWERENRKPQARAIGKLIIWCKENGIDLSDVEEHSDEDKT